MRTWDADWEARRAGQGCPMCAEGKPFTRADFDRVLALALDGIARLVSAQRAALR